MNMRITDNEIWDSKRIVKEYIQLADCLEAAKGEYERLARIEQVKAKHLASAISACLDVELDINDPLSMIGQVFYINVDNNIFRRRHNEISRIYPITEKRYDEALTMVKDIIDNKFRMDRLETPDCQLTRLYLLDWLLRFRKQSYKLTQFSSGILEGCAGLVDALTTIEALYFEPMKSADEKVDTIIGLLLGTPFDKSFTEEELIMSHKYPTTTDKELFDWWADNQ